MNGSTPTLLIELGMRSVGMARLLVMISLPTTSRAERSWSREKTKVLHVEKFMKIAEVNCILDILYLWAHVCRLIAAKIPFGGKEHNINEYEVLVYA